MRLSDLTPIKINATETDRVLTVERVWDYPEAMDWAVATFCKPGCKWSFRKHQADALYAMHKHGGLIAPIGVGHGKTLIFWLAAKALEVKKAVGMMPPRDVPGYLREIQLYRDAGFDAGEDDGIVTSIVPYSTLSQTDSSRLLDEHAPEAIVLDEAHALSDPTSARTKRFLAYMAANPRTKLVAMSGTLFKKSIVEVAHLAKFALRDKSPMPRDGGHLMAWANVLDVKSEAFEHEYRWFEPVIAAMDVEGHIMGRKNRARRAAYKRFVSAPGVVTTETASCDQELLINQVPVEVPQDLLDLAAQVKTTMESPDGQDILESPEVALSMARDIVSGFYYTWDWSNVEGGRSDEWLMRRRAWARALRNELAFNSSKDYDSPALVERAIDAALDRDPSLADKSQLYWTRAMFREVAHIKPGRKTVWINKYLIDWVLEAYPEKAGPTIIWYQSQAFEDELRARGVPVYGKGTDLYGPARWLAASILVHGQARRLHDWCHAVVIEPPGSGAVWEQLLGRLHRGGQTAPVCFDIVTNPILAASLKSSKEDARFIESMSGTPQKLLSARFTRS